MSHRLYFLLALVLLVAVPTTGAPTPEVNWLVRVFEMSDTGRKNLGPSCSPWPEPPGAPTRVEGEGELGCAFFGRSLLAQEATLRYLEHRGESKLSKQFQLTGRQVSFEENWERAGERVSARFDWSAAQHTEGELVPTRWKVAVTAGDKRTRFEHEFSIKPEQTVIFAPDYPAWNAGEWTETIIFVTLAKTPGSGVTQPVDD